MLNYNGWKFQAKSVEKNLQNLRREARSRFGKKKRQKAKLMS
jgi:hypothetical protein